MCDMDDAVQLACNNHIDFSGSKMNHLPSFPRKQNYGRRRFCTAKRC